MNRTDLRSSSLQCWLTPAALPRVLGLAAVLAGLIVYAQASAEPILRSDGFGAVRVGMTFQRAERAIGSKLTPRGAEAEARCWYTSRADGHDAGVAFMIENNRVTRIDVGTPRDQAVPRTATAQGIHIGSSRAELQAAYGAATEAPAPYGEGNRLVTVLDKAKRTGMQFLIVDGRVEAFWSGREPSMRYTEGCS